MSRERRSEQIHRLASMRIWLLVGAGLALVIVGGVLLITLPKHLQGGTIFQSAPTPNALCKKPAVDEEVIYEVSDGTMQLSNPGVTPPVSAQGLPTRGIVDTIVSFNDTTPIFQQKGKTCNVLQRVSYQELKAGQRVRVWSQSDRVEDSYPAQIPDTSAIVILP